MTPIFLLLEFRDADGSFTFYTWFLGAVAMFMVGSGIWSVISPKSYVRYTTQGRWVKPATGHFWTTISAPRWVRTLGALAIVVAVGFMTWVLFFTAPGALY